MNGWIGGSAGEDGNERGESRNRTRVPFEVRAAGHDLYASPRGGRTAGVKPTASSNRMDAVRLLKKSLGESGHGKVIRSGGDRTTFQGLAEMLIKESRAH